MNFICSSCKKEIEWGGNGDKKNINGDTLCKKCFKRELNILDEGLKVFTFGGSCWECVVISHNLDQAWEKVDKESHIDKDWFSLIRIDEIGKINNSIMVLDSSF